MKKEIMDFPCNYPIKIVGKMSDDFKQVVSSILHQHIPEIQEENICCKPSKQNNYLAITATFNAKSKQQLDDLYQALSDHPLVLMAL